MREQKLVNVQAERLEEIPIPPPNWSRLMSSPLQVRLSLITSNSSELLAKQPSAMNGLCSVMVHHAVNLPWPAQPWPLCEALDLSSPQLHTIS